MVKREVAAIEDAERGDKFVAVMAPFVKSSEIIVSELKDALVNLNKGYEDVLRRFGYNPKVNKASDAFFKMLYDFSLKFKKVRSEYEKEQQIHAERDKRERAISRSAKGERHSSRRVVRRRAEDDRGSSRGGLTVLAMGQGTQRDIARAAAQRRTEAAQTPVASTAISSAVLAQKNWHRPASGAEVARLGANSARPARSGAGNKAKRLTTAECCALLLRSARARH